MITGEDIKHFAELSVQEAAEKALDSIGSSIVRYCEESRQVFEQYVEDSLALKEAA